VRLAGGVTWMREANAVDCSTMKDFAGPVATVIAAFSAVSVTGYFAFRQWQTAREKLLLDLFEKRFAIYEELLSAVVGRQIDQTTYLGFKSAASRARFLFGPKVQTFLDRTSQDLLETVAQSLRTEPIPEDQSAAAARLNRLNDFSNALGEKVAPYMNHHQKAASRS
jgi:hypothetical protein